MNNKKIFIGAGSLTALLIILAALWVFIVVPSRKEDKAWENIQQSGVLRVGLDASYPPFEFVDAEGQVVGFDVDLANEIADRLDVEVTFTNIPYDGLYDSLFVGNVDVLISALVAAPEFEGRANFTRPYFNIGQHLVTTVDVPFTDMQSMDGHTLAVEYGSGGDVEARVWERRLGNLTVERYEDPSAALGAVTEGNAEAALVDGITAHLGVGENDQLQIATNVTDELIAVAVHPDSEELRGRLTDIVTEMIEDGTISELTEKWFGPQR